jgi:hypothetical protein
VNSAESENGGKEACIAAVDGARTLFVEVAERDGTTDRSGLLAQLELERRYQTHGFAAGQRSCIHHHHLELKLAFGRLSANSEAHEGVCSSDWRQALLLRRHETLSHPRRRRTNSVDIVLARSTQEHGVCLGNLCRVDLI